LSLSTASATRRRNSTASRYFLNMGREAGGLRRVGSVHLGARRTAVERAARLWDVFKVSFNPATAVLYVEYNPLVVGPGTSPML